MSGVSEIKRAGALSLSEYYRYHLKKDPSLVPSLDFYSTQQKPLKTFTPDFKKGFLVQAYTQELKPEIPSKEPGKIKIRIKRYKDAIKKEPGNAIHYINLGRVYLDQEQIELAEANFREAIHMDEHNPDGYYYLAEVCYLKQNLREALDNYNQALSLGKTTARLFYVRGFLLEYYEKYQEALDNYDKALKLNPEYIEIYKARGDLRERQGLWDQAVFDYQEVLENSPHQTEIIYKLGSLLESLERYDEALVVFDEGIELNDNLDFLYLGRGYLKQTMGDLEGAAEDLEQAIRLGVKDIAVYQELAKIFEALHQPNQSLEYYKKVVSVEYGKDVLVRDYQKPKSAPFKTPKNIDDEIKELTIKINANKRNPSFYLKRAELLEKKEDWKQVVHDYQKALALDSDNFDIRIQLGLSYLELDQIKKANQLVEEVLTQQPDHPKANYLKGKILAINEQWQEALKYLDLSIQKNPSFAPAYIVRGDILAKLNRISEASRDFSTALILDPDDSEASKKRALLSYGYSSTAIADLRRALTLDPDNIEIIIQLGKIYAQTNHFDRALPYLDQAIDKVKTNWELYFLRGQCHENFSNIDQAIQDYTQAIQLNSSVDELYQRRANLFDQKGNYAKAYQDWSILHQRNPDNILYHLNQARAAKLIGKLDQALKDFLFLLEKTPDYSAIYIWIGDIYFEMENFEEALSNYNQGIKKDPRQASYYFKKAEVYEKQLQFQEAITNYNLAIELRKDEPHYYLKRGRVYEEINKNDLATADYKASLELKVPLSKQIEVLNIPSEKIEVYENLTKAIELQPQNSDLYYKRSKLLSSNQFVYTNKAASEMALKDINKAIDLNPFNEEYYLQRSIVFKKMNRTDDTIKDLEFLISINPKELKYYEKLTSLFREKGDNKGALDTINRYLPYKDHDPHFYIIKANVSRYPLDRIKYYKLALQHDPTNYNYRLHYLNFLTGVVDSEVAVKEINDFFKNKNDPEYFYCLALIYYKKDELTEALENISKAIKKNPYHPDYYVLRAKIHHSLNNYQLAEKDFDQAIKLNPSSYELKNLRIKFYADNLQYKKEIEEIKKSSSRISNKSKLISSYVALGDYENALKVYESSTDQNPQELQPYQKTDYLIMLLQKVEFCYFQLGDREQALRDLDRIAQFPDLPLDYYLMSSLLFDSSLLGVDEEIKTLLVNHLISVYPNESWLYIIRARLYQPINIKKSIADMNYALARDPNQNRDFFNFLGRLYQDDKQYDLAIRNYKKSIELGNPAIGVYRSIFHCYAKIERYEEGLEFFNTYHEKFPDDIRFFIERSKFRRGPNRNELMIEDYSEGLALVNGNIELYTLRIMAYMRIRKYEEALADIDRVLDIDPNRMNHYVNKAEILEKMGKPQEAIQIYDYILQINPNDKMVIARKEILEIELQIKPKTRRRLPPTRENNFRSLDFFSAKRRLNVGESYARRKESLLATLTTNVSGEVNYKKILEKIDEYIKNYPNNPWGYALRAYVHFHFKKMDECLSDLHQAQRLSYLDGRVPKLEFMLDIIKLKNKVFLSRNQISEVSKEFDRLVQAYPQSYTVVKDYVKFLKSQGKIKEAIQVVNNYLKNHPKNIDAHLFYTQLLAEVDIDQAIIHISKIIDQSPYKDCLLLRAELYMEKNPPQIKRAEADLKQAIELGNKWDEAGDAYIARAKFWWSLGQYSKAIHDLDMVIENPSRLSVEAKKLKLQYATMKYDISEIKREVFR